jgi:hypothetical protein
MSRKTLVAITLAVMAALILSSVAFAITILVDGNRESLWNGDGVQIPGTATDGNEVPIPPNDPGINDNVDIQTFQWTNSPTTFYFLVDVYASAPLMTRLAVVDICLNTDNSSSTDIPTSDVVLRDRCSYPSGVSGIDTVVEVYLFGGGNTPIAEIYNVTTNPWTFKGYGVLGYNPLATNPVIEISVPSSLLYGSGNCPANMPVVVYYDGGDTNPDDNLPNSGTTSINCGTPTAVSLASFTAVKASGHNALAWETNSELHNLGFNVWRGTSADGPDVKLNTYVIPSQAPGGTGGFAYTYNDSDIVSGATYYYWLEDVDLNGTVTRHGPAQALVADAGDSPNAVTLTALQGNSSTSALPVAALGLALVAGLGVVVRRRS